MKFSKICVDGLSKRQTGAIDPDVALRLDWLIYG
jgi:hypothetical protein